MDGNPAAARFPTTIWSRVVAAQDRATPEARAALAELCGAYWFPLYALIRRKGNCPEAALDLTQGYFARLLERGTVAAADPAKGRFRSFLVADCTRFLADRHEHERALKRGGGAASLSIDARDAEGRYLREPSHGYTAERLFEREWALALLDTVLALLRHEYERSGRGAMFDVLKVVLTEGRGTVPQAEMAARLGVTAGAVQVAVHRLKRRYREVVREAIGATVGDVAEVEDEIRDLFNALGGSGAKKKTRRALYGFAPRPDIK
jgi:RNA polymerase sigma-70 factor (ECF subfamily)